MEKNELILRMEADCKILGHAHRNRFTSYRNLYIRLGLPAALLATAAGSLTTISADAAAEAAQYSWLEIAGISCTWAVALCTAATSFLRPQEISQGHKEKAGSYDVLLSQIGRSCEYLSPEEELKKDIERIDIEIGKLKKAEPFLSGTRIRKSKNILIRNNEISG